MFPCPLCDVKLNSAEQRRAHCRGKNHIKREEARKKAEELGADFDRTPDHCEVCNVPLTSKMTAIDHFKGKMHQKKLKAVEEQRLGFKNYCEICDVRLQSLKVSDAHFKGKQHNKRERKSNSIKGKKKNNNFPASNLVNFKPGPAVQVPKSSSWENINYDSEIETKDIFGDFRTLLRERSLNSDTPSSSSPDSSTEILFSFNNPVSSDHSGNESPRVINHSYFNDKPVSWEPHGDAYSEIDVLTQAVVNVLKSASEGISSGDIATEIPSLSPCDINIILKELEKKVLVAKSGYAPILWSWTGNTGNNTYHSVSHHNMTDPYEHGERLSKDEQNVNSCYLVTPDECNTFTKDFLSSSVVSNTSIVFRPSTLSEHIQDNNSIISYASIIEAEILRLLDEFDNALSLNEIKARVNGKDDVTIESILQQLFKRNVIVKDGDERWRRRGNFSRNNIGVIGEERKRRSPVSTANVTNTAVLSPLPFPLHTNNTCVSTNGVRDTRISQKENGDDESALRDHYEAGRREESLPRENVARNTFNRRKNGISLTNGSWSRMENGDTRSKSEEDVMRRKTNVFHQNFPPNTRSSPPLSIKTETCQVLDNLTLTTPKLYQKELYECAMLEDSVCYLPSGTGQDLVMAQVIAHMILLNPSKQAFVIVQDVVTALQLSNFIRKELCFKGKRKKVNIATYAGSLKQCSGRPNVSILTSVTCLSLLNCGALSWRDVCLLIFYNARMCSQDEFSKRILHEYYMKSKIDFRDGYVPKLLSFLDSSDGDENFEECLRSLGKMLSSLGDIFLCCVEKSVGELQEAKREAMYVSVHTRLNQNESKMFFLLGTYLNLVFDNLAAQWTWLNTYQELLKISFREDSVNSDAFLKLIEVTGQPSDKRPPCSPSMNTWRHYLAICEVIFTLVECGEDLALELLLNLARDPCGFVWANDVGLPGFELSRQLFMDRVTPNWVPSLSSPRGSGLRELLQQLMIIEWENARVSSERPLALVLVKLNKTANVLGNYLSRCGQLMRRNVKTAVIDGSRSPEQKAIIRAMKRRQYQVIISTDNVKDLPVTWELVVLMDSPTTENALGELRVRNATNIVALSPDCNGEYKLKQLLKREESIEKAISYIRTGL